MKSFAIPTRPQIDAAVQRMRSPEFAAYFLSRLENPNWVTALAQEGVFSSAPPPVRLEENRIAFPHWPASKYLARMAKHVAREVAEILAHVKTENASVVGDILDAALAMPAADAALLVPTIGEAARAGTLWIHFKDASDLCVELAKGGEVGAALTLASILFSPRKGEREEQVSRRDLYWYKEGLSKVVPVLSGLASREFLQAMCGWLNALVGAKEHVKPSSGDDYSYWWRPAVEEHEQNHDYELTGVLVGFLRQGLEHVTRVGALSLHESLAVVSGYPYLIFKRIAIHLINEFAEQDPQRARETMMDRALFDDFRYKHEYAMLVGRRLGLLTAKEREQWFEWIEGGPDMSGLDTRTREELGRDATDEERANRKRYWRFEKLHCVRTHLEGERRAFHDEMLAAHGQPDLADLNSRTSTSWGGGGSPISVDELSGMTFEQAVKRVSSWAPSHVGFSGPDFEGLASAFGAYVGTNPTTFSAEASVLVGQPAPYVRKFISQMTEAIKAGREIDVPAVLGLCQWVLGRPPEERTSPSEGPGGLLDADWQWTRDEISRFTQAVLQAKSDGSPRYPLESLREPIWRVVDALSRDPAKSNIVHDTSKDDPRVHDYLTLGINSPRGKAVEAALDYARWVANHAKTKDGEHEIVPGGFGAMPEVQALLEWQVADANRSVEVLALIGSQLGLIYWIDRNWLAATAPGLFHLEGIEESPAKAHGWAAWNAFLVWVRPHVEFYKLFRDQYSFAVVQSGRADLGEPSHERPMDHLGEHLMVLYGRGELGLDDDGGLLRRFLAEARPDIRRHAIGFVGQILERESDLPQEFVDRYQSLWEVYWAGLGKADAEGDPGAWLFGLWFSSGRFSPQWAIARLHEFNELAPLPEPDHEVVSELARVASADMPKVLHVLERMVLADQEGWRVHAWLDSARSILEQAMKSGGESRKEAERLINQLGRRGHIELGNLLGAANMPE